jgi:hypothetical protein
VDSENRNQGSRLPRVASSGVMSRSAGRRVAAATLACLIGLPVAGSAAEGPIASVIDSTRMSTDCAGDLCGENHNQVLA